MEKTNDIVIIGCGAGGATAAQFAKKTDRKAEVTIFESSPFSQYSKCGIPYLISGQIPTVMDLIEFSEDWFKKSKINLSLNTKVTDINSNKKIITAKKNKSIIKKTYSSLIIATGAIPRIPPINNIFKNNSEELKDHIFTVRTLQDAKRITAEAEPGLKATVVGAGLIGLEMADALNKKGLRVTIIETLPTILINILDEDMCKPILDKLKKSISIHVNTYITEVKIKNNEFLHSVIIKDQSKNRVEEIPTDILIIAAGIKPETHLAEQAGCKIGLTNGIQVNECSQTSKNDIYAVGDCTEYLEFISRKPVPIGLGSIAVRQGIVAGINAAGGMYQMPKGVLQTATSKFFDIEIGSVGPSLQIRKDLKTVSAKYKGLSKPEYFPGGTPITMKIFVNEEDGNVIGAQAVGENASQRVNTYATAILAELSIDKFRKLETAYAPPIAPTLDVVTLTADIASMKWHRKKKKNNEIIE